MIVTVTPNPALDTTYVVSRLDKGASHRVGTGVVLAGGKGLNVARVLHQMGRDVLAVAHAGGAAGDAFRAELSASGIPASVVVSAVETRRSVAIVDESSGDATVLNERGAMPSPEVLDAMAERVAGAAVEASVVVLSGSLAPGTPVEFIDRIVSLVHEAGAAAIVDTSGPGVMRAARAGADLLKPNLDEVVEATGETDPLAGARLLLAAGARAVVVSLGADGVVAVRCEEPGVVWRARLPERLHGNPTGAGDAACAALAAGWDADESDFAEMLVRAVAWSGAAVLAPVAGRVASHHAELAARVIVAREDPAPARAAPDRHRREAMS